MLDLSQPWSADTPPWPTYEGPTITWAKRLATHRVNGTHVATTMHVGTHLDAPLHFLSGGKDIASLDLDFLVGPAVVCDISDALGDYGLIEPRHITERVEVRAGDILVIHTGYHHYFHGEPGFDEVRYFFKHPGPDRGFAQWLLERKVRWLAFDCGSADHPMNTILRTVRPELVPEAEAVLGQKVDIKFPVSEYQVMHTLLFPRDVIHVENLGGEIDQLLNQRTTIGCFPWKFVGGDAAMCRVVAFLDG
jgi:kynurenine formamidase